MKGQFSSIFQLLFLFLLFDLLSYLASPLTFTGSCASKTRPNNVFCKDPLYGISPVAWPYLKIFEPDHTQLTDINNSCANLVSYLTSCDKILK